MLVANESTFYVLNGMSTLLKTLENPFILI